MQFAVSELWIEKCTPEIKGSWKYVAEAVIEAQQREVLQPGCSVGFEAFTAVIIQVIFWIVAPCSVVVGH
jgi:hypothetical protein